MTSITIIYQPLFFQNSADQHTSPDTIFRAIFDAPIEWRRRGPDAKPGLSDGDIAMIAEMFYRHRWQSAQSVGAATPARRDVAALPVLAIFCGNDASAAATNLRLPIEPGPSDYEGRPLP